MVKAGDKFIIEIESAYYPACAFTADDIGRSPSELMDKVNKLNFELYKIKGFNTLVFDDNGLHKLERYQEPDKSLYFNGWDSGTEDGWQLAKKVANLPAAVRDALFGYADPQFIFRMYSAEEAMKILVKYEEE